MFRSLRARLWLSYAVLIVTALAVVGIVLVLFILRNPFLYRQAFARLSAAETVLSSQASPTDQMAEVARAFNVRVILFSADRRLIADSSVRQSELRLPADPLNLRPTGFERDGSGKVWLYSARSLPDGTWLLTATPRPKVAALLGLLSDELSAPFLEGGLIALLLSLVLAFLIARSVADPLQDIIAVARTMPSEKMRSVEERGPHEVRELARSFNAMVERVRASRAAQRDLVANVSHELKTPLTSIQGFAQALMDGTAEEPEARHQAAQIIHEEAARMHRMALDLLDLAKWDSGTAVFKHEAVDVVALLHGIRDKFQPMAEAAGVALTLSVPEGLPALLGDGDRLAQALSNLVDNAIKFTTRGGNVKVRAMSAQGEIQVTVEDTGRGIPGKALPHIFDRFYRSDSARAGGDQHGAGLGLAIAHEVVAAHGGRISVRSAEGRGTGFVVHLPLGKVP